MTKEKPQIELQRTKNCFGKSQKAEIIKQYYTEKAKNNNISMSVFGKKFGIEKSILIRWIKRKEKMIQRASKSTLLFKNVPNSVKKLPQNQTYEQTFSVRQEGSKSPTKLIFTVRPDSAKSTPKLIKNKELYNFVLKPVSCEKNIGTSKRPDFLVCILSAIKNFFMLFSDFVKVSVSKRFS